MKNKIKRYIYDTVDSTNLIAKELAKEINDDALILAKEQTAGRGREKRVFYSASGGIYMSLLVHPKTDVQNAPLLTFLTAAAVSKSIKEILLIDNKIKWVNDILVNGKKVCGILCESALSEDGKRLKYAIIGIGINFSMPNDGFNPEIKDIAASLLTVNDEEKRELLINSITDNFYKLYKDMESKKFMEYYKNNSCISGKEIEYFSGSEKKTATVLDITDKGELSVLQNGENKIISPFEIRILRK